MVILTKLHTCDPSTKQLRVCASVSDEWNLIYTRLRYYRGSVWGQSRIRALHGQGCLVQQTLVVLWFLFLFFFLVVLGIWLEAQRHTQKQKQAQHPHTRKRTLPAFNISLWLQLTLFYVKLLQQDKWCPLQRGGKKAGMGEICGGVAGEERQR